MSRFTVEENDGFVEVTDTRTSDIVLSFASENPRGDIVAVLNIMEEVRRAGFRESQVQVRGAL